MPGLKSISEPHLENNTGCKRERWRGVPLKQRLSYFSQCFIEHKAVKRVLECIERELVFAEANNKGVGLLVISPSGGGKTTLIKHLKQRYPDHVGETLTTRPVVHFKVPKSPTQRAMGSELLKALGDPMANVGTAEVMFERAKKLVLATQTKIIAIDDFQDIPARRKARGIETLGDWIRDLCEMEFPGLVVALGTEEAAVVRDSNTQLLRRMQVRLELPHFSIDGNDVAKSFGALVLKINELLPLAESSEVLKRKETLVPLYLATGGSFDYLMKLMCRALARAVQSGKEQIEIEDFRKGFDDQHEIAAQFGNPFDPDHDKQRLIGKGQIFYRSLGLDPYGSRSSSRTV